MSWDGWAGGQCRPPAQTCRPLRFPSRYDSDFRRVEQDGSSRAVRCLPHVRPRVRGLGDVAVAARRHGLTRFSPSHHLPDLNFKSDTLL